MKKILSLMLCLMLGISTTVADELSVNNITIPKGGKAMLSISLTNTNTYRQLFEFVLTLPEGISMVENSQTLSERFGTKTSLEYREQREGVYQFICTPAGTDRAPISGNSGALMTLELQADASLIEGTSLDANVTNIELTTSESTAWNPSDMSFAIIIGEPADTRVVLDENSATAPETATGVDIRVKRTINAGEWSTICLPFGMTEAQMKEAFGIDVQLGDFTGADSEFDDDDNVVGITVNFQNVTAIEANHPYIIKVSAPVTEFTLDGVDIVPVEDEAYIEFDNGKTGSRREVYSGFYGTYHAGTVLDEHTLFLNAGKFLYSTGQTLMKAFRAYFAFLDVLTEVEEGAASTLVSIRFDDGESTGIKEMEDGRWKMGNSVYDLQGRRVASSAFDSQSTIQKKGIYVKEGKKVVIK